METLISPDILLTIAGGVLVTLIATLLKKWKFAGKHPQWTVGVVALLLGVVYYVFGTYVPVEYSQMILNFIWGALSSGVLIYEFIWKNLNGSRTAKKK